MEKKIFQIYDPEIAIYFLEREKTADWRDYLPTV